MLSVPAFPLTAALGSSRPGILLTSHPELLLKERQEEIVAEPWDSPCKGGRGCSGHCVGLSHGCQGRGVLGVHGMQLRGHHHLAPRGMSAWCQLCHHVWDDSHWFLQRKAWPHGHKDSDSYSSA